MFNLIKNAINVENINFIDKCNRKEHNKIFNLVYEVNSECIFADSLIPILNIKARNAELYKEILDKMSSTLNYYSDNLWNNKIIIKNIGNSPITYDDFYKNDKLCFNNSLSIIAIQINSITTKKYINTEIMIDNDFINIKFDTIEAGDFIELNVISYHSLNYIELLGKTKIFGNPQRQEKIDENSISYKNKIYYTVYIFLLILSLFVMIFCIYIKHENLSLYIRNPFVIKEVQNVI